MQRRCFLGHQPPLAIRTRKFLDAEVSRRIALQERSQFDSLSRADRQESARTVWRDLGALKEDWIRKEFMLLTKTIGLSEVTAPKTLRHCFATTLQDANVDPLVRNELMGHAPQSFGLSGISLHTTAVYTHTRPETKQRSLLNAFSDREAIRYATERINEANFPALGGT
jgi:site-specific recombinase XerD